MTPPELVRSTRKALGLSVEQFAKAVQVESERTVRRWESEERDVPGPVIVLCVLWRSGKLPKSLVPTKERPSIC